MQRLTAEPAFVLHRRQYSESSLLLDVLTPAAGRVGMIARGARGARSGLAAALQPFQELRIDASGAGDLLRLSRAEAIGGPLALAGERALAGMYCNELVVRFLPRGDALGRLFERYRAVIQELSLASAPAWALRRFERDLLAMLGYGCDYVADSDGARLDPQGRYRYVADAGFVATGESSGAYRGHSLLALSQDSLPDAEVLRELRRLMRELLSAQLQGAPLRSWSLLSELPARGTRTELSQNGPASGAESD